MIYPDAEHNNLAEITFPGQQSFLILPGSHFARLHFRFLSVIKTAIKTRSPQLVETK
jgi:hypothetical protein